MKSYRKIEVLSKCCSLLRLINLSSTKKVQINQIEIPNMVLYTLLSIPLSFSIVCDFLKVFEMEPNFHENANSFLFIPGTIQMQMIYFCLARQNDLIIETVNHIQRFVNRRSCSSDQTYEIFHVIELRNTKLAHNIQIFAIFFTLLCSVPQGMYPLCYAISGYPSPNEWQLPLPMEMFINTNTYLGFLLAWLVQLPIVFIYVIYILIFILLFLGLNSYVDGISSDFETLINHSSIWKNTIELHDDMLRLLDNTKRIMSGPLFFELLSVIIIIVFELLALDYAIMVKQFDSMLILIGCCLIMHMSTLFILCHHSECLTTNSNEISKFIYCDCQWYKLPNSQQKLLTLPISRSQKPFRLDGFGIFDCSQEMFLKIIRLSISYYIVMRKLKA